MSFDDDFLLKIRIVKKAQETKKKYNLKALNIKDLD